MAVSHDLYGMPLMGDDEPKRPDPYGLPPKDPNALTARDRYGNIQQTQGPENIGGGAPAGPDPFASIGGGVYANGGWTPAGMGGGGQTPPSIPYGNDNVQTPVAAPAPATNPNDPFASIGGGVQIAGGGWVPLGHPLAQTAAAVAQPGAPATGGYTPPNAAPGTPGATNLATQNSNAQTYSGTPGAAPTANTTNQGTQDTVRNSYLQSIQKGTNVDTNDPNFRQQADAYGAAQERARRNAIDDSAQANFAEGTRGSGAENVERRMAEEVSARNQGQFESQLVGRELESRRSEIQNALSSLGGMISGDQKNALERELAALNAAVQREGIQAGVQTSTQDMALRDKLGTGALNVDLMRALLQNQQAGNQFGLQMGQAEFDNMMRSYGL